jgi:hypothetical protein
VCDIISALWLIHTHSLIYFLHLLICEISISVKSNFQLCSQRKTLSQCLCFISDTRRLLWIRFRELPSCKAGNVNKVRTSETSVDNHFTRQYIPEDNFELIDLFTFPALQEGSSRNLIQSSVSDIKHRHCESVFRCEHNWKLLLIFFAEGIYSYVTVLFCKLIFTWKLVLQYWTEN